MIRCGDNRVGGPLEHAGVATFSEQFANLERQMRALMDGATELQESLRALSLDQSIVQTAIPAALMVTAGKGHKWPETVAGSCNCEAELNDVLTLQTLGRYILQIFEICILQIFGHYILQIL